MTDRELLEIAATAAGIEKLLGFGIDSYAPYWINDPKQPEPRYWNPLIDDGDALRLAVSLKLEIYHAWDEVNQVCVGYPKVGKERTDISYVIESYKDSNISEATRRAIVRAAAEIGKSMKGQK